MKDVIESDLRTILDNINCAILIHEIDGKIIDVNTKMLELYKLKSREEAIQFSIQEDYSAADNPIVTELPKIWGDVVAGKPQNFEFHARRPTHGSTFEVEVTLRRISLNQRDVILATVNDISERKKTLKTITQMNNHLKGIIESTTDAVAAIDTNYQYLAFNTSYRNVVKEKFGVEISMGDNILDLYPEEVKIQIKNDLDQVLAGERFVLEDVHGDGENRLYFELIYNPMRDNDGNIIGATAFIHDATQRRRAEEASKQASRNMKAILESTNNAIYAIDTNYRYLAINNANKNAIKTMFGIDIAVGDCVLDLPFDEEMLQKNKDALVRAFKGEKFTIEDRYGDQYLELAYNPISDTNNDVVGAAVFARNVTDKKKSEIALQEAKESLEKTVAERTVQLEEKLRQVNRFKAILDSTTDLVSFSDLEGKILYLNPAGKELLEIEELPKIIPDLHPSRMSKTILEQYLPIVMNEGIWSGESAIINSKGMEIPVHQIIMKIHDEMGEHVGFGTIMRDLRQQKEAEAKLKEQVKVIRKQQQLMIELSTPVIQIWEGILVLPLIGVVDSKRATQIMRSSLEAITRHRARLMIIDITGVPMVDTEVANHLIKTIQAAKLVGAKCMLVGISSEVAQTLVHIGIDLDQITTFSTLEDGLQDALAALQS